jgi:hypothetical protein
MDHLDLQVKNLQVTGLNGSPANNRYLQVPKGVPTGIKIQTQSNSKNSNKTWALRPKSVYSLEFKIGPKFSKFKIPDLALALRNPEED